MKGAFLVFNVFSFLGLSLMLFFRDQQLQKTDQKKQVDNIDVLI